MCLRNGDIANTVFFLLAVLWLVQHQVMTLQRCESLQMQQMYLRTFSRLPGLPLRTVIDRLRYDRRGRSEAGYNTGGNIDQALAVSDKEG
jgi:hypothetical protein